MKQETDYLVFSGELPAQFEEAMAELGPLLGFVSASEGVPVEVCRAQGVLVEKQGQHIRLGWHQPVQLYRALSLLREAWNLEDYHREEEPCFEIGMMFDVSRNACLRSDNLRYFFRCMALMGFDVGMLYTEDTYEVPGEPYIGYMRGRYSQEELGELDDYAALLGIELIPCIQTLGHLNRVLHWPAMAPYADNDEVILADSEKSYALLRRMVQAASAPFRSRRIHIGMDEADGIGLGTHLATHGYEGPHAIMRRHLLRVKEITDNLGLKPMMWSDMYFRLSSPTNGYYDGDPQPETADLVPGVDLVYWDYYHHKESDYAAMLDKHQRLTPKPLFAGGIWTWAGPAPDYEKTLATTIPALTACQKAGVPFVLATAWGDDGAETNLLTALPGMQVYAEFAYTGSYDPDWLAQRFQTCCGMDIHPFWGLSRFNHVPGMQSPLRMPVNAAKFLLYQDPLVQLFAQDTQGLAMARHYEALATEYAAYATGACSIYKGSNSTEKVASQAPRIAHAEADRLYALVMDFYAKLARVLASKCYWHENIKEAVAQEDRKRAQALGEGLLETIHQVEALRVSWRTLWQETNKPYGFEIIDGRMGALRARLETARSRVLAWAHDQADESLPELKETALPYLQRPGGLAGCYGWADIVSACR